MIVDFTISNFRSIKNEQTFSLRAENGGEHLLENISHPSGDRLGVLKTAGIYGANASGKSNILLAIRALQYIVGASGGWKDGEQIKCYEPFQLSGETKKQPVRFEIEFITPDDTRYIYTIGFTRDCIVEERLVFYPSSKPAVLFERDENDTWESIKFGSLYSGGKKKLPFFKNNAYLSKAGDSADAPDVVRKVYNYFRKDIINQGVNEKIILEGWQDDDDFLRKVSALLSFIDTGVSGVVVENLEVDEDRLNLPMNIPEPLKNSILRDMKRNYRFIHDMDDDCEEMFDLEYESAGTQRFFNLAPALIDTLSSGGVLIVDELDGSMHPFMGEMIIRLFNDPEVNQGQAQLIFTTHDISLMSPDRFRRDQIWLTEKRKGATAIFSLDDFDKKKVKPTVPFSRWYVEGRFGAVPKIDYRRIADVFKQSSEDSDA